MKTTCMRKAFFKDFEIKNSSEYHDLHLKYDTLLLVNVFESVKQMCIKFYHLDHVKFLSAPGLAKGADSKKAKVKLELLTDVDMPFAIDGCKRN